jgi:hypothetical protein
MNADAERLVDRTPPAAESAAELTVGKPLVSRAARYGWCIGNRWSIDLRHCLTAAGALVPMPASWQSVSHQVP